MEMNENRSKLRKIISIFASVVCILFGALKVSAQVSSKFSLVNDSFVSSAFEAGEKNSYQFFTGQLKTGFEKSSTFNMDLSVGYAFGASLLSYINVTEFYASPKLSEDSTFSFGRKLAPWSELDRRWALGVFEPTFQWNPLTPKPQGLTGIFWSMENSGIGVELFVSSFYIPDQGPSFEIKRGRFEKGNPWFRRPPEYMVINGVYTAVNYDIKTPEMSEVIFRQSFAGRVRFGEEKKSRVVFSMASKPSNQIAKTYRGFFNTGSSQGDVEVVPVVYEHVIYSGDLIFENENWQGGVSTIYDHPSQPSYKEGYTHPVLSSATLVSPYIEARFLASKRMAWKLGVQGLNISGGQVEDQGEDASDDRAALTSRYPFQRAAEIYTAMSLHFSKKQKILSRLSYMQSDKNKFSIIKWNNLWSLDRNWELITDLVLVDAAQTNKENQNDISQFTNHDRLIIGASYAF